MKTNKIKAILVITLAAAILLTTCACGTGNTANNSGMQGAKSVSVSNVDELLAAIAPDTTINLEPGIYNLSEAALYGKVDSSRYYSWNSNGFSYGYELRINGVDGLSIKGIDAELVTTPRFAYVLAFVNCDNVSIEGVRIGHTEAAEACEGGVVLLDHCDNAQIAGCKLYGCGTTGVEMTEGKGLTITDSDIYHCSNAGVYFTSSKELKMENCRIFDCGSGDMYGNAAAAFVVYDGSDITVDNCEIWYNYLDSIVEGRMKNAVFSNLGIEGNHLNSGFDCSGDVSFKDLNLEDNVANRWIGEYFSEGRIVLDGKNMTENKLRELWPDQLSSSGIGISNAEYLTVSTDGAKEIHVNTADEFLAAIASDTLVVIDAPQINLMDASDYGQEAGEEWNEPYFGDRPYVWNYVYDGYKLCIGNLTNFHIRGGEIITEPRYADVLSFYGCTGISLENVRAGHSPEQGECCGGVLYFRNSSDVIVQSCDLYGCGTLGISAEYSDRLNVQDTNIHDCSYGAATFYESSEVTFLGCTVENCPSPEIDLENCKGFSWDKKNLDPYSSFNSSDIF